MPLLILASLFTAAILPAQTPPPAPSHAYEYLEELSDGIGARLTGSAQEKRARAWVMSTMGTLGLANVRHEPFPIARGWERISARAELRLPSRHPLTVTSQGWAGSTRKGGIEAEVATVDAGRLAEETRTRADGWKGKILLLTAGQPGSEIEVLRQTPLFLARAHAAGAAAVIDATTTSAMHLTRADSADITGGYTPLPVVRMAPEHQSILSRLAKRGRPARVWLDVQNRVSKGAVETANVTAEIPGAELPGEVVLLCAHLDSWDLGQGAGDDGFGVAAVLGAAETILRSGAKPRRTIRLLLTSGEEQGVFGSLAYARKHRAELDGHVAVIVADMGYGAPAGWALNGREDLLRVMERERAGQVSGPPMKATAAPFLVGDSMVFTMAGVPAIDMHQDARGSSVTRHTQADTLDKVKPQDLNRAVEALAGLARWMADRPERPAPRYSEAQTKALLEKIEAKPFLELLRLEPVER